MNKIKATSPGKYTGKAMVLVVVSFSISRGFDENGGASRMKERRSRGTGRRGSLEL